MPTKGGKVTSVSGCKPICRLRALMERKMDDGPTTLGAVVRYRCGEGDRRQAIRTAIRVTRTATINTGQNIPQVKSCRSCHRLQETTPTTQELIPIQRTCPKV